MYHESSFSLLQFFNKTTYNFIVHEKGARNLSTRVLEKLDITITTLVSETMKNIRKT